MITYRPLDREYMENVKELYAALGWTAYLGDDPRLYRAWEASLYALGPLRETGSSALYGASATAPIRC